MTISKAKCHVYSVCVLKRMINATLFLQGHNIVRRNGHQIMGLLFEVHKIMEYFYFFIFWEFLEQVLRVQELLNCVFGNLTCTSVGLAAVPQVKHCLLDVYQKHRTTRAQAGGTALHLQKTGL